MRDFRLTSTFDDCFEYGEETIHLYLCFDNILRVFEMFSDGVFTPFEKIDIALEMLILNYEAVENAGIEEKNEMLLFIFREHLDMDFLKEGEEKGEENEKVFDFEQDAGLIFASFLRAYNMDLFEQHGKLHWLKFIQLLHNLDDKSKLKEVINIRQMPLPKPDKYNTEQRKQIQKMKQFYSLNKPQTEEEVAEQITKKWDALASTLKPK